MMLRKLQICLKKLIKKLPKVKLKKLFWKLEINLKNCNF